MKNLQLAVYYIGTNWNGDFFVHYTTSLRKNASMELTRLLFKMHRFPLNIRRTGNFDDPVCTYLKKNINIRNTVIYI